MSEEDLGRGLTTEQLDQLQFGRSLHKRPSRDIIEKPYSPDEQRVAEFFFERGAGGGGDPIGFVLASYEYLVAERNDLRKQLVRCRKAETEWRAHAARHNNCAEEEYAIGDEEWMMHKETARCLTRCADDVKAALTDDLGAEK